MIQSEDTLIRQWRRIHLQSLQTVPLCQRDPAPKDRSLNTHAEWSGRLDQPNDPGEGDDNVPASRTKARVLSRSVVNGIILINLSPSKEMRLEVPHALWSGNNRHMAGSVYLDAKPIHSYPKRKGPSWHPMQLSAYFPVMDLMRTSATSYGTLRIGN